MGVRTTVDALSTEVTVDKSPRVIVGVTPSDPPPSEVDSSVPPSVEGKATRGSGVPTVPIIDAPVELDAGVTPRVPAVVEAKADIVAAPVSPAPVEKVVERPPASTASARLAETLAFGSSAVELPAAPPREAEASVEPARADEVSVPPASDVPMDETFFSDADVSRHLADEQARAAVDDEALDTPDTFKRKSQPHVVERRARLARYVKWAVAGAAIVCVAAVARTTLTSKAVPSSALRNAAAVAPEAKPEPKPETPPETKPTEAKAAAPAIVADTKPETKPEANAAPVETAAPAAAPPPAPAEEVSGDPKEEKKKSRTALEKGKLAEAIEAGEKSVKLDPTDGEAWLLLGAAYQEKADMTNARRAYTACVKDAKTGPRHECAKMLR